MSNLQTLWMCVAACVILLWLLFALAWEWKVVAPNLVAVLRYGPVLRTFALILALSPPTLMLVVVASLLWRNNAALNLAGGAFLASSLVAGLLLIETNASQVFLTEDSITRYSLWTGLVALKWSEIERIGYSPLNRWMVLAGAGKEIRVSRYLHGLPIFVETAKKKLTAERYASAAEAFELLK